MNEVTFILTSCGRPDLLMQTLKSFVAFNTYPIAQYFVFEDSGIPGINTEVEATFPFMTFINAKERQGQIIALDTLYSKVNTPYVFSCEDDWTFYKSGFIEKSMSLMEKDPLMLQVWLRSTTDINGHPTTVGGTDHRIVSRNYKNLFHGFSFNPGLRRLSDYKRIGTYGEHTKFDRKQPGKSEIAVGKLYYNLGYYSVILKQPCVIHSGENRHVS